MFPNGIFAKGLELHGNGRSVCQVNIKQEIDASSPVTKDSTQQHCTAATLQDRQSSSSVAVYIIRFKSFQGSKCLHVPACSYKMLADPPFFDVTLGDNDSHASQQRLFPVIPSDSKVQTRVLRLATR